MYLESFKILKEKVPFVEFMWRTGKFIINPQVETHENFKNGDTRFALWDIVLALTLITVIFTLIHVFTGNEDFKTYKDLIAQTNMIFSIGYYTIPTLLSFYVLVFFSILIIRDYDQAKIEAMLCTMQFARFLSLMIIFMVPFIVWYLHHLATELESYQMYVQRNFAQTSIITAIGIALLIWCLIYPLRKRLIPQHRKMKAYPAVLVLLWLSSELNQHIPSPVHLNTDGIFSCDSVYKSQRFLKLNKVEQTAITEKCEATEWGKSH